MRHNQNNKDFRFFKEPVEFNKQTDRDLLQYCLGAALYMPATKAITEKVLNGKIQEQGLTTMVMDFEDAIRAKDLGQAEDNVTKHLQVLSEAIKDNRLNHNDIPLTFLRVRNTEQFQDFSNKIKPEEAEVLTGFVFPKFHSTTNGYDYLNCLESLNSRFGVTLYGMPILEGRTIAYNETRASELEKLKAIFAPFRKLILNIRVGGTDFSSIFGVRRGINYSIYDILPVRDCLSDILNCFNRSGEEYIISGPVWEYFLADKKESLNHLLETDIHHSLIQRQPIINEAIDGLLREVVLDKANGFVGKTIIHPSHVKYVNAMQSVTKEEYEDSCQILSSSDGVVKGKNKMNEINPHKSWAKKINYRAKAYGVIEDEAAYLKLFF